MDEFKEAMLYFDIMFSRRDGMLLVWTQLGAIFSFGLLGFSLVSLPGWNCSHISFSGSTICSLGNAPSVTLPSDSWVLTLYGNRFYQFDNDGYHDLKLLFVKWGLPILAANMLAICIMTYRREYRAQFHQVED